MYFDFLRQLSHHRCSIFFLTHQRYIRLQTDYVVNNTLKEEGPLHFYENTTPHIFIISISMLCTLNQLFVQCRLFIQQCTRQPADQQSHHLFHSHTIPSAWSLSFFLKKVCVACSRTNNKIVLLTNWNKCVYNEEMK